MYVNNIELKLLVEQVQIRFGKKISFAFELEELSNHIKKNTNITVSVQSLRRIFGFIKDGTIPSRRTINILCTYCGYDNIIEFINKCEQLNEPSFNIESINLIKEFFNINVLTRSDFIYQNACGNITKYIIRNKNILNNLKQFVASNKISQIYFIERHPYIDGLCNGYDEVLKLYIQEKKTKEASLFGNCLLLLGSFLSENKLNSKKYIEQIIKVDVIDELHPFLQARKISSNILFNFSIDNKENLENWINYAIQQEKKQNRYPNKEAYFPFYQYILADTLLLIDKYQEADYFLKIAFKDYKKIEDAPIENEYFKCLELIDLINTNNLKGNRGINKKLRKFNTSELHFGMHDYYTIQLKISTFNSMPNNQFLKKELILKEILELINKTGFHFFSRKISSFSTNKQ